MSTVVADDDAIDLRAVIAELRARRWWLLASVLLFGGTFTAYALLATPIYRSSTILVPANDNHGIGQAGSMLGGLGGLAAIAGLDLDAARQQTEEALAVLRSREFTERFIGDRKLMPKLFASKWDATRGRWLTAPDKQPTPAKAYRYFDKKVRSIVSDKKTGLVTLNIDWKDRGEAAAWANDLVARLNAEMRARAIRNADASLGFLEAELKGTDTVPTRDALGRLIEVQVKQRMLANVTPEYAFRVVDRAMPSDHDDPLRPQKLKLIAAGLLLGVVLGALAVLVASHLRIRASG